MEKPVFSVFNEARLKRVSSATETSQEIESSPVVSLDMMLSNKRITKALISLRRPAGWSAPLLVANPRRQFFSLVGSYGHVQLVRIRSAWASTLSDQSLLSAGRYFGSKANHRVCSED